MRHRIVRASLLVLALALGPSAAGQETALKGWSLGGSRPEGYAVEASSAEKHEGHRSVLLRSQGLPLPQGFGALMQTIQAENYRGRRVRFSAFVRSSGVTGWAGLYLRVDGLDGRPLGFDNMQRRPIRGESQWQKYEAVMDVAPEGMSIAFGVLLYGQGQVWMSGPDLETVSAETPVTATYNAPQLPKKPVNLDLR